MKRDLILEGSEKERVIVGRSEEIEIGKHRGIKITSNLLSS